ncbi:iron chaperone [Actinoplanes sp. CA-030573]|uniref:iron chaperone n=1 Tax=Actinoplanes sp. CA-030573 TaxID=3239898 RepID=UPI003D931178
MAVTKKNTTGFSDAERGAMKERNRELKAGKGDTEAEVLAKIEGMPDADRAIAGRLHEVIKAAAPELTPKTWYGMPAYYRDGKMICFVQAASKFKARFGMLGFSDQANLDDGDMWPAYYAVAALSPEVEARVTALVRQAVSG